MGGGGDHVSRILTGLSAVTERLRGAADGASVKGMRGHE